MNVRRIAAFGLSAVLSIIVGAPALAQASGQDQAGPSIDERINALITPFTQPVADAVFWGPSVNGTILPLLVVWLMAGAIFFTFYMRFINLRGFRQSLRIVTGRYDNPDDPGEVTHFQALTAALSGTVGLGNIAGVAIAISIGGPGATFWMILAGLFGMTSKFVECTLGHKYREIDENGVVSGGPMYYLSRGFAERGFPKLGRTLAIMAAVICIGGSLGSGSLFQTNQATAQVMNVVSGLSGGEIFAGSQWFFGLLIAIVATAVVVGGIHSIVRVTERLVPIMALLYVGTALVVIAAHASGIPAAFGAIVTGAISPEGVAGGFIGVLVQGFRRAAFSNEAGIGSAAIAHAAAKTTEPVAEGLVALMEPFVDTVVICTITALVIILTGQHLEPGAASGITLTSNAFATVFTWFPYLLSVAAVLFAFSTSITWFYYGQRATVYLFGDSAIADRAYKAGFVLTIILGSGMQLGAVINFADAMILGMAFPNMVGLYVLAPEVKRMLKSYLERVASGEIRPYKELAGQPAQ